MVEIFIIQFFAAALGAISTALADRLHDRRQIGPRLHTFWVSVSIAAIYLPVLSWISNIFLGPGLLGTVVVAIVLGVIFYCVYWNLPRPRSFLRPSCDPVAPVSEFNGPVSKFNR
jgi:drug/metabolite transporter (DMT)-like permease